MESLERGIDRSGEEHEGNLRARPSRRADDRGNRRSGGNVSPGRGAERPEPAACGTVVVAGALGADPRHPNPAETAAGAAGDTGANDRHSTKAARNASARDHPHEPHEAHAPAPRLGEAQPGVRPRRVFDPRRDPARGRDARSSRSGGRRRPRAPRSRLRPRRGARPGPREARGLDAVRGWPPCEARASSPAAPVRSVSR
jgi:hypothetical protein